MTILNNLVRGLGTAPPWAVGLARGILEAVVMAALIGLGLFLTNSPPAAIVPFVPVLLVLIRYLEGAADSIDPAKQRDPNQP